MIAWVLVAVKTLCRVKVAHTVNSEFHCFLFALRCFVWIGDPPFRSHWGRPPGTSRLQKAGGFCRSMIYTVYYIEIYILNHIAQWGNIAPSFQSLWRRLLETKISPLFHERNEFFQVVLMDGVSWHIRKIWLDVSCFITPLLPEIGTGACTSGASLSPECQIGVRAVLSKILEQALALMVHPCLQRCVTSVFELFCQKYWNRRLH